MKAKVCVIALLLLITLNCSEKNCSGSHAVIGYWEGSTYDDPYERTVKIYLHFTSSCEVSVMHHYHYTQPGDDIDIYECEDGTYKTKFSDDVDDYDVVKIYNGAGNLVGELELCCGSTPGSGSYRALNDPDAFIWRGDIHSFYRDSDPPDFDDFCN